MKLESQLTFLQGPLPLSVDLHVCCKRSGDISEHEGARTSVVVGESNSYFKRTKITTEENDLEVFTV